MSRSLALAALLAAAVPAAAQEALPTVEYSHGAPSAESQRMLWLVNRARSDPVGEGDRIFADYGSTAVQQTFDAFAGADPLHYTRTENRDAWRGYATQPPVAFHPDVQVVAHGWSVAMRTNDRMAQFFGDQPSLFQRLVNSGYGTAVSSQLIQGFAPDVLTGVASWTIDWGQTAIDPATGRPATPNRLALMNLTGQSFFDFVEAGCGVVRRTNPPPGGVGPRVMTLVMAARTTSVERYATGVVYEDKNGNGEYDIGEGLRGVRIDVSGSGFHAISATAGGYAVPVNGLLGPIDVRASGQRRTASEIFGTQIVTGSTLAFGKPGNVLADFVLAPRDAPPERTALPGPGGAIVPSAETVFPLVVPAIDPARPGIGDVDLAIDLAHPDRSRLQVKLVSPTGTEIVLWESGDSGSDVVGTFDATLRPVDDFGVLEDEPYAGTWSLVVTDTSGLAGAQVNGWTLLVRPRWEGPLLARRTHLFVSRLEARDKKKLGKDRLTVDVDLDLGAPLPAEVPGRLQLVLRDVEGGGAEILREDVAALLAAPPAGTNVSYTPSFRGTSRTKLTLRRKGLDLPAMPRDVRVEIVLDDALLSEDVRLTNGRFRGKRDKPLADGLRIEKLKSRPDGAGAKTTVRGRYKSRGAGGPVPQIVEVRIGTTVEVYRGTPLVIEERRVQYGAFGRVKRLVLNPRTGTFSVKLVGDHDVLESDGTVAFSLWLGKFYGEAVVTPRVDGTRVDY